VNLYAFSYCVAFRAYCMQEDGCFATPGRAVMKLHAPVDEVGLLTRLSEDTDDMLEAESKLPTEEPQEGRLEVGDEVAERLRSQL